MSEKNADRPEQAFGVADANKGEERRAALYGPSDREDAVRLLTLCEAQGRIGLLPESGSDRRPENRIFVVRGGAELLGIALLWQKDFHPLGRYLDIRVLPDRIGEAVEEILMQAVLNEAGDRAIQVSFGERDRLAASFYVRFGFAEMRRTYMPKLRLEQVVLPPEEDKGNGKCEAEIRSFAELKGNGEALDSLAELMRFAYANAHEVNPPADYPVSVWRTFAEADDLLNEGSFAAFAAGGNEAIAFAALHEGEREQEAELGWLGARNGCDAWMQAVERKRMAYALAGGFRHLIAEIDTTDPYQRPLLEKYPFELSRPLLTYRREADGAARKAQPEKEEQT